MSPDLLRPQSLAILAVWGASVVAIGIARAPAPTPGFDEASSSGSAVTLPAPPPPPPPVAAAMTVPRVCAPPGTSPVAMIAGVEVGWGDSPALVEGSCGVLAPVPTAECALPFLASRASPHPERSIVPSADRVALSYFGDDGLFEAIARSSADARTIEAALARRLGPPESTGRIVRWVLGDTRVSLTRARQHFAVRAWHPPIQERFSSRMRGACPR